MGFSVSNLNIYSAIRSNMDIPAREYFVICRYDIFPEAIRGRLPCLWSKQIFLKQVLAFNTAPLLLRYLTV